MSHVLRQKLAIIVAAFVALVGWLALGATHGQSVKVSRTSSNSELQTTEVDDTTDANEVEVPDSEVEVPESEVDVPDTEAPATPEAQDDQGEDVDDQGEDQQVDDETEVDDSHEAEVDDSHEAEVQDGHDADVEDSSGSSSETDD